MQDGLLYGVRVVGVYLCDTQDKTPSSLPELTAVVHTASVIVVRKITLLPISEFNMGSDKSLLV